MSKSIYKYSVAIQCMTYNHSKYIEDALNGFIMQNTDFPYVILLVDDASTDGEGKIIAEYVDRHFDLCDTSVSYTKETEYAKITYAQHKTNLNCFIVAMYLKYNHYQIGQNKKKWEYVSEWQNSSKYIALCEGDDYWTDSNKLQKQVDFLDNHKEYSMCFHHSKIMYEVASNLKYISLENRDYSVSELFDRWIVPTASMLCRMDILKYCINDKRIINGDINLVLTAAHCGSVYGMADTMSVYRVQPDGITIKRVVENNIALQYKYLDHYRCLYENFDKLSYRSYSKAIANTYVNLMIAYLKNRKYGAAIKYLSFALVYNLGTTIKRLCLLLSIHIFKA